MEKYFRQTNQGIIINVRIIPDSRKTCLEGIDPWKGALRIKVKEKAVKGKANKEALKLLEKEFI